MRKITFYIDDVAYFNKLYRDFDFPDKDRFRVVYTLFGNDYVDRYELVDDSGNPVNINSLNGFQRGIILNDCMAYFNKGNAAKFAFDGKEPFGVMSIVEENIDG